MQEERGKLRKELLSKNEPVLGDLGNVQPIQIEGSGNMSIQCCGLINFC